ncbi:MAG: glycosyltransferase, partial [Aureliella sp.]
TLATAASQSGHKVDLLLMLPEGPNLARLDPAVRIVPMSAPRLRRLLRPLVFYLRKERPDALQVSMWPMTIIAIIAVLLARTRTRVVTADHTNLRRQYGTTPFKRFTLSASLRLLYPFAHRRIAVSKGSALDLEWLSGTAIETIYNPIPSVAARTNPVSAWKSGLRRLITVGALKEEKNHLLLLDAMALLGPDVGLVILGDGPLRAPLEARIANLGLDDRVTMPGYLDPGPYYNSAELFVLSSDYEGFGNVIVEAMSAGLPVVSTDCPDGPSEILEGGTFGTLVSCGDANALAKAIRFALETDPQPMRQKARAAVFNVNDALKKYLAAMLD